MDLIYMNSAKEDIGVLFDYQFDLAFGSDENDFQLKLSLNKHCCEAGYFIYIEGTEYGGIIDGVEVDTEQQTVVYSGRTWHGILSGHVIQPDSGFDYYVAEGDANAAIAAIIERLGLEDTFTASTEPSDIEITKYKFARYTDAYSGICAMLAEFGGKLKMEHKVDTIVLSAVWRMDFSKDEEWDDSQVGFNVKKNYRPVNHLICLGSGNLKDRHTIHLFTDENGGVQPYANTSKPDEDSDYILDTSKQLLFGIEEVAEVYDYSGAQTVENHILLTEQPEDWSSNYESYFKKDDENGYVGVEGKWVDEYTKLTAKPADWEEAYANYFAKDGDKYVAVEGDPLSMYSVLNKKPADWEENYANYFTYWSDGLTYEYKKVTSVTKYNYVMQTMRPSDFVSNYKNYYEWKQGWIEADPSGEITGQEKIYPTGYYALTYEHYWKPNRYYTKVSYQVAPTWEPGVYYTVSKDVVAPDFSSADYYSYEHKLIKPSFVTDTYFRKAYDNYADLVAGGLERLKSSLYSDSIRIEFDLDGNYDIGDIVGAHDQSTGIDVWQPVTKKIVTIKDGAVSIDIETEPPKAKQSSGASMGGGSIGGIVTGGGEGGQDGKDILGLVYPVGAIYLSTVATSPATLFGFGTWERIQDRFLLAAGSTYSAGATGGEATHTLTVDEMPKHTHKQLGAQGGEENTSPVTQLYQNDGNVVVYDSTGAPLWYTSTMSQAERIYRQTAINQDGITGEAGGNKPHNNMPPYLAVYVWKRTA